MQLLLDQIVAVPDTPSGEPRFTLTPVELILAGKAVGIVRREIDAVEFHTRVGVEVESADKFLSSLSAAESWLLEQEQAKPPTGKKVYLDDGEPVVALDIDELSLVNNALNEILHGLPAEDSAELGEHDRARANELLEAVNAAFRDPRNGAQISARDGDRVFDFTV